MQKNTASQKWTVFAFQDEGGANPGEPVTGDAANITANLRIDGGAANAVDDTNPTELERGCYVFDITQAESNGNLISIHPVSATANVNVIGVPGAIYTTPASFNAGALALASNLATANAALVTIDTEVGVIDGIVDSILADTGTDGVVLTSAQVTAIVAAVKAMVVESNDTITLGEALSIVLAYTAGEATGQDTTGPAFLDPGGNTTRISAVTDGAGNRSSVTLTPSS